MPFWATMCRQLRRYNIPSVRGDPDLRAWIVGHIRAQGVDCTADNILITSGSQQALEFLGKLFLSPGDTALVTAPTYLGALQAFAPSQPVFDELDLAGRTRTAASYSEAARGRVSFAYVVPDFANPTGQTLDIAEREELLTLAAELQMPIIEDSPYSALRFEGQHQPSLQSLDIARCGSIERSRVVSCGSFSKIFTPGLRVGWVCAATSIITKLGLIKQSSDLNSPAINQRVMLHLARNVWDEQVARSCDSYRAKRDVMLSLMARTLPEGSRWSEPEGGMFVWVTLPEGMDAAAILARAVADHGIAFVPGHAFHADGRGRNTMRLSFSLPSTDDIVEGMRRLQAALR
ncbi:PLP-dependent aminotransferase family protein [Pontivivens nitratireducens]|uniref:aminotransferase-like domain-containing protein n=1 Tax=Pontivivens nitratireducens TaxID=2758038 RepID=UPI0032216EAC